MSLALPFLIIFLFMILIDDCHGRVGLLDVYMCRPMAWESEAWRIGDAFDLSWAVLVGFYLRKKGEWETV